MASIACREPMTPTSGAITPASTQVRAFSPKQPAQAAIAGLVILIHKDADLPLHADRGAGDQRRFMLKTAGVKLIAVSPRYRYRSSTRSWAAICAASAGWSSSALSGVSRT
nr:Uncharacterised protein [Raoultella sp. NCTC 9187]